ncbi:hypothetical protein HK102_010511 [Quaeritorhiza haematococci]|nr:hypothetical protein HK102_010511 [Quaeritorhiza haematococci]
MDDTTLKVLKITVNKEDAPLTPAFQRLTREYDCFVRSDATEIHVTATCNEPDAFCQVGKSNGNGVVPIKEGMNRLEIKVDAVDGSTATYVINIHRPSGNDATLRSVAFAHGTLAPGFHRLEERYLLHVDPHSTNTKFKAVPTNQKSTVQMTLNGDAIVTQMKDGEEKEVPLLLGDTLVQFLVTSADKSTKRSYTFTIRKDKPGSCPSLLTADTAETSELICSICTSVLFRPRKIVPVAETDANKGQRCDHRFCLTCLDLYKVGEGISCEDNGQPQANASAEKPQDQQPAEQQQERQTQGMVCPLCAINNDCTSTASWENDPLHEPDTAAEIKLGKLGVSCPFHRYGCAFGGLQLSHLGEHVLKCQRVPVSCEECGMWMTHATKTTTKHTDPPCTETCRRCSRKIMSAEKNIHEEACKEFAALTHDLTTSQSPSINPAAWEAALSKSDPKAANSDMKTLLAKIDEHKTKYLNSLKTALDQSRATNGATATSITPDYDALNEMAVLYATAIAKNHTATKNSREHKLDDSLHTGLASTLEEIHMCRLMFPLMAGKRGGDGKGAQLDANAEAAESSIEDEVKALLMQLGVSPNASDAVQIQALENEYERLIGQGQSAQAAEVQNLAAWKVKKAHAASGQVPTSGKMKGSIPDNFAHVLDKYKDAVEINPSNAYSRFHYGRWLLTVGDLDEAVKHLRYSLVLKPKMEKARLYLGLALVKRASTHTELKQPLLTEGIMYLEKCVEKYLNGRWISFIEKASKVSVSQPQPHAATTTSGPHHPTAPVASIPAINMLSETWFQLTNPSFVKAFIKLAQAYVLNQARISDAVSILGNLAYLLPDEIRSISKKSGLRMRLSMALCEIQRDLLFYSNVMASVAAAEAAAAAALAATTEQAGAAPANPAPASDPTQPPATTVPPQPSKESAQVSKIADSLYGLTSIILTSSNSDVEKRDRGVITTAESIARGLVAANPTDARFLGLLGQISFEACDHAQAQDPDQKVDANLLSHCEELFKAAISAESGGVEKASIILNVFGQQAWWKQYQAYVESTKKILEAQKPKIAPPPAVETQVASTAAAPTNESKKAEGKASGDKKDVGVKVAGKATGVVGKQAATKPTTTATAGAKTKAQANAAPAKSAPSPTKAKDASSATQTRAASPTRQPTGPKAKDASSATHTRTTSPTRQPTGPKATDASSATQTRAASPTRQPTGPTTAKAAPTAKPRAGNASTKGSSPTIASPSSPTKPKPANAKTTTAGAETKTPGTVTRPQTASNKDGARSPNKSRAVSAAVTKERRGPKVIEKEQKAVQETPNATPAPEHPKTNTSELQPPVVEAVSASSNPAPPTAAPAPVIKSTKPYYQPRLGLARVYALQLTQLASTKEEEKKKELVSQIRRWYQGAIKVCPGKHDPYIELGTVLEKHEGVEAAAEVYSSFPFELSAKCKKQQQREDDLFLHGEITRTLVAAKRYKDEKLIRSMIAEGTARGMRCLEKYVNVLDAANESKTLMKVYAGVNKKSVDDPDMVAFFKAKYWI